ncbi:DgyrCDS3681 [Dimorphilus gyrociliatus]|uniref:DgyrCDS3681 n=1 Tax=Dimorphilus gyrociliatus TaxID=2664684 RepID=A0A7I8VFX4_9ANNE|nr:DgyrCDS3681 [Dimorphilus gyrociliatus]
MKMKLKYIHWIFLYVLILQTKDSLQIKSIARNTLSYQSSRYQFFDASRANDDIIGSNAATCSHTLNDQNAWWATDLAAIYNIQEVYLLNRNSFDFRLANFKILVKYFIHQTSIGSLCFYETGTVKKPNSTNIDQYQKYECPQNTTGSFIIVEFQAKQYLTICDIIVVGEFVKESKIIHLNSKINNIFAGNVAKSEMEKLFDMNIATFIKTRLLPSHPKNPFIRLDFTDEIVCHGLVLATKLAGY